MSPVNSACSEEKVEVNDDEIVIDDEQIGDYCGMLDRLGIFPEKVAINNLSMAAEDFASSPDSASILYDCIRWRLVERKSPGISSPDRKLPLVYVLDSLLKNVKGVYTELIQDDASNWMAAVYDILDEAGREEGKSRLKKVWNTWKEFGIIRDEEKWKHIGDCFLKAEEKETNRKIVAEAKAKAAGIGKNPDGSLQIIPSLRKQMQLLLDEVQSTGVDELDKVSLERLADINPDLLLQIKKEADIVLQEKQQSSNQSTRLGGAATNSSNLNGTASTHNGQSSASSLSDTQQSDWNKLQLNHLERSHTLIASLQRHVRSASQKMLVARSEVQNTVHLYAAVSASAQVLTEMLHQWKTQNDDKGGDARNGYGGLGHSIGEGSGSQRTRRYFLVEREKFTTDGVKERNDSVIARLYEVGLPFICSADGRRFATQIELSKHLDALFRKSQLEKTMEQTEERQWYIPENEWIGASPAKSDAPINDEETPSKSADSLDPSSKTADEPLPSSSTVLADETRDRCTLCGINFDMFFDQEDGEWKYRNCVEKSVWKDSNDATSSGAEDGSSTMLVHVTCWQGLGSPEFLTADQILHAG